MKRPPRLVLGLILLVAALGSWWLTRSVTPPAAPERAAGHEPDYTVDHFTASSMNEHGRRRYLLTAPHMVHFPDNDTAHFTRPYLIQYPEDGSEPVHTRADEGVMPGDGREILMMGHVRTTRGADPQSAGGEIESDRMRIELDR